MKRRLWQPSFTIICFALFTYLIAVSAGAQDFFAGLRGGTSFDIARGHFYEAEAFAGWKTPWRWDFYSHWNLRPGADVSVGWLASQDSDSFVGALAPQAEIRYGNFPVSLEGGAGPALLSHSYIGQRNFGDRVQFISHIGLEWDISKRFTLGARLQHMSNAGLATPNPGLNIEMLSVRFNF
jgi:Lipid A 3-O-deacylase (PagL)